MLARRSCSCTPHQLPVTNHPFAHHKTCAPSLIRSRDNSRHVRLLTAAHGMARHGLPRWSLTLERALGPAFGTDSALQATSAFSAEVFPDLPIATTWDNLLKVIQKPGSANHAPFDSLPCTTAPHARKVITVAAQLRSSDAIEQRIMSAAGINTKIAQPASALLCVSGSHPVRSLPLVPRLLHSSVDVLRAAKALRENGRIRPDTQLWCVANPNMERNAEHLERKADAGATTVLTQPLFDSDAFSAWTEDAARRGIWERVELIVGHPTITSYTGLSFWLALSGMNGQAAALKLQSALQAAQQEGGAEGLDAHCRQYALDIVSKAAALPGAAGLHVMPIGAKSRALALALLKDGSLTHPLL